MNKNSDEKQIFSEDLVDYLDSNNEFTLYEVKVQFINLKKQYLRIQESLEDSLKNILDKSNFIQGEQVQILEEKLSSYIGANCITVANGTDAIFIALRSLGIGRGDEVILPSFTWVSTAETVSLTGKTSFL